MNTSQSERVTIAHAELPMVMARKAEAPPYEDLINYSRAKDKDDIRCVMCGLPPGMGCAIPRQNKDVCKDCDKSTWQHTATSVYFKWCKGCKKFLRLGSFSEKMDAAKCDRCRERGRQSYLLKKGKDGSVGLVVPHSSGSSGGRSRSNSVTSMKSDFESELADTMSLVSAAQAIAAVSCQFTPGTGDRVVSANFSDGSVSCGEDHDFYGSYDEGDDTCSGSSRNNSCNLCNNPQHQHNHQHYLHHRQFAAASPSGAAGDTDDLVMSARAVISFSESSSQRFSRLAPPTPPAPHQDGTGTNGKPASAYEEPVVIDDESADVTKSKLSSVFGKPLRELSRRNTVRDSCTPPPAVPSAHGARTDGSSLNTERNVSSDEESCSMDGELGSSFRGTLYELACIHERIVTLEENASRVKCLEDSISQQERIAEAAVLDVASLRAELASEKRTSALAEAEVAALKVECAALRKAAGPLGDAVPPTVLPSQDMACKRKAGKAGKGSEVSGTEASAATENRTYGDYSARTVLDKSAAADKSPAAPSAGLELNGALRGALSAATMSAVMEHVKKRPRTVSMGD